MKKKLLSLSLSLALVLANALPVYAVETEQEATLKTSTAVSMKTTSAQGTGDSADIDDGEEIIEVCLLTFDSPIEVWCDDEQYFSGDYVEYGSTVWIGMPIDDYVNKKLLINGNEFELTDNGSGYWYNIPVIVDSDADIQVVQSNWSADRLANYVTLNADANVTVWFYNSYFGEISWYDNPIKNGGYIGKDCQICIRIPSSVYSNKPYVYINGTLVDCSLNNDGMWQIWAYDVPDNSSTLRIAVSASAATKVDPPTYVVKGVFGGRVVTFNNTNPNALIYISDTTSNLTQSDFCVKPGESVLFQDFYGTVYAKAYYNGKWSNPARLILKIPKVNTPTITKLSNGKYKIKTTTPGTIVYYTIDGSTPSADNYAGKFWTSHDVYIPAGRTVKAVAVRTCFTDSEVATAKT